ncbi:unnamed protein product, partial [Owenia fusiformis]
GGTCKDRVNGYTCSCVPEYNGQDNYKCTGPNIRVVHVGGSTWGRLEVYYNNAWGTVCDDYFDDIDAKVACKHLGMSYEGATFKAYLGGGTGDIWLDDMGCVGT